MLFALVKACLHSNNFLFFRKLKRYSLLIIGYKEKEKPTSIEMHIYIHTPMNVFHAIRKKVFLMIPVRLIIMWKKGRERKPPSILT